MVDDVDPSMLAQSNGNERTAKAIKICIPTSGP